MSTSDQQIILEPQSEKSAKQLVILLHGLGADGNDMIDLAPSFAEILPDAQFVAPNAPFSCDMSPFGFQWFSLMSFDSDSMLEGAKIAQPLLDEIIDSNLEQLGLTEDNLALVGFSQGTMMSLHNSLRRKKPPAGVLGYAGSLLDSNELEQEATAKPEICLIHGMIDPVVPFIALNAAETRLNELGVNVETHARPLLAHGIDPEGISIGKRFLKRIFS